LPIRFDTYKGCSHGCKYCFVQKKANLEQIKKGASVDSLRSFIEGRRDYTTQWCDWNIPIHWGGMSDPFQPVEAEARLTLECLRLFAETKYPFVVSTKGKLVAAPEYLELIQQTNSVVQISMVCPKFNQIEPGCPSYDERLQMVRALAPRAKRVIARAQPYMPEVYQDVMDCIPRLAEAGVYGIVVEGMKFFKAKKGLVRVGGDNCYPLSVLRRDFEGLRSQAHRYGLAFYSGENRLRNMGDDLTCCGTDGLEGFRPNEYNLCMMLNGKDPQPTEHMKKVGTGGCFKAINQNAGSSQRIAKQSFYGLMHTELSRKTEYYKKMFGLIDT